jgi:Tfp pilus assembly protein PilX
MRLPASVVATAFGAVVLLTPGLAQAKWTASGSGTPRVGATTMRNATAFTSTCVNFGARPILLTWTDSADTFVASYTITRTGPTPAQNGTATVAYGSNNFYLDQPPRTNSGDTYTYTIKAVLNNWVTPAVAAPARTYTTATQPCA